MTKNLTILAIDSTGHFSSAGIFDKIGNELFLTSYDCNFKEPNSELLSKSISSLISGVINQSKKEKIDMIAITLGPGSFTKIRSSLSFARGLALGLKIPLIGVNSFQKLFYATKLIFKKNVNLVLACDTFRNSIFYSFQSLSNKDFKNKIEIRNFDNLMKIDSMYTDNNIFIVGDASIRVFQELENNGLIVNNVIKPWDLYDEIGLKSLVKLALENFNNNILNCDPVYITEPITNKKKTKI